MASKKIKTMDEPEHVTVELLREITDNFSEKLIVGKGSYGVVYKGMTKNGDSVAVKKLLDIVDLPDLGHKQFQNEFDNLKKLKHKNIVQVLAYCYETEKTSINYYGRMVQAETIHRALCFEYMHKGSLQDHLSDEFHGLDWQTRYKIIKGTCQGLKYIHEELEEPLYHLDLKPGNVLLNEDMVPKIADFGLSRLVFGKELVGTTESHVGTMGYQPPEYLERNEISEKFDIFSLGVVMMKILSGPEGRSKYGDNMSSDEIIDLVQNNWRNMLKETCSSDSLLEAYCNQVKTCTQIALTCMEYDSKKRLIIAKIIDTLNETETQSDKLAQERCHNIIHGVTMHNTMTMINMRNEQNDVIIDDQHHSNLMTGTKCNEQEIAYIRSETSSNIGEELILGRNEEKEKIMASLLQRRMENLIILPIYGIGGIGKTTLAKLIYNDDNFKYYSHVWVYVSQRFDLEKIVNSIISQLSEKEIQTNGNEVAHRAPNDESLARASWQAVATKKADSHLTQLLSGKKVLIVLDDLWEDNPFQLEELRTILNPGNSINIIVLVTTRSQSIAEKIDTTLQPYNIKSLTDDVCWEIIKQISDFEARDDKTQLMGIGWGIALKCKGVALAAKSLGFMLKSMTSDKWMEVKDNDIWNNESISDDASLPNHVLASLKLSYTNIDDLYLKLCFTYCALFTKGQIIVKHDLIYQWISLGFIKPTKMLSITQLCEKYIAQLLGLSFLQPSVSAASVETYVTFFTMHDLVHDLARLLIVDEILLGGSKQGITGGRPYALLTNCSKPLKASTSFPDKIRALRFIDCDNVGVHSSAFSSARSLLLLDLSNCRIHDLPCAVGQLEELVYLRAPMIRSLETLKCITKLSQLIYLNLSGSCMSALPKSIGEIKGLMHLDISNCILIRELPESFINLRKLVHLDVSGCSRLTRVWDAFVGLTNMQYLCLSRGSIIPLHGLHKVIDYLFELRYLGLSGIISRKGVEPDEIFSFIDRICTLSHLEHLDLSNNEGIVSFPESIGSLNLHGLNLSNCWRLKNLPERMVSRSKIIFPYFVVNADNGESCSNIGLLARVNRNVLYISNLENVKSAEELRSLKLVQKQQIKDLKLAWTTDAGRSVEDVEVLGKLLPPSTLTKLQISGYNNMSFPSWVMAITLHLPNLTRITIYDLPKCNELPPLGQLPVLEELVVQGMDMITTIRASFCGGTRAFPRLKKFDLFRMQNLEAWNIEDCNFGTDGTKEFMMPKLQDLEIRDCPKLTLKACPPIGRSWVIENSDNVLSSSSSWRKVSNSSYINVTVGSCKLPFVQWKLFHCLQSYITLHITDCPPDLICDSPDIHQLPNNMIRKLFLDGSAELHSLKWLSGLQLHELSIAKWTKQSSLHESIRQITSLLKLELKDCSSITALPEWLGDLPVLNYLKINGCTGIKSLPESICKLKLDNLCIICCPELVAWCNLSVNKTKLRHIKEKIFSDNRQP